MNELDKKLAEWAGFKFVSHSKWSKAVALEAGEAYYVYPNNSTHKHLPNFTESLDACEKWLIPKLPMDKIGYTISFEYNDDPLYKGGVCWMALLGEYTDPEGMDGSELTYEAEGETMSLAFCRAIEKLIEVEK